MLRFVKVRFNARSWESGFPWPVMAKGDCSSTRPAKSTWAVAAASDERPLIVPLKSWTPNWQCGWMEASSKWSAALLNESVPRVTGNGTGDFRAAKSAGAGVLAVDTLLVGFGKIAAKFGCLSGPKSRLVL